MKKANIAEAKNRFSALIDIVRGGETILIVDRDIPVARLEPAARTAQGRIERLQRKGVVRAGSGRAPLELLREPPPAAARGRSGVEALLDERREGR